jgi:hypothetical protein
VKRRQAKPAKRAGKIDDKGARKTAQEFERRRRQDRAATRRSLAKPGADRTMPRPQYLASIQRSSARRMYDSSFVLFRARNIDSATMLDSTEEEQDDATAAALPRGGCC